MQLLEYAFAVVVVRHMMLSACESFHFLLAQTVLPSTDVGVTSKRNKAYQSRLGKRRVACYGGV